jgi:hypothetical protein
MNEYLWAVWKECRLVGYVKAYSEHSAIIKAENQYGKRIFLERTCVGQVVVDCSDPVCPS